ncbi:nuclear transport factor 2 family protein [Kineococcus sp. NPDC059986]|uniref:nuclear transport factor 2 family protein n=1 Tax=Kineococcus sp. NPDC059986 TaxID=3155538 RepID=UPI00344BAD42
MSTLTLPPTQVGSERALAAQLHAEVEQFYAHHFHLLDAGDAVGWSETFTPDGSFHPQVLPEPVRGRAALAEGVALEQARLRAEGVQRRHWHGMVAVTARPGAQVLDVRCYAQILSTPHGGTTTLRMSCVCEDVLVLSGDRWLVAERRVTRDDLTAPVPATRGV